MTPHTESLPSFELTLREPWRRVLSESRRLNSEAASGVCMWRPEGLRSFMATVDPVVGRSQPLLRVLLVKGMYGTISGNRQVGCYLSNIMYRRGGSRHTGCP